MNEYCSLWRRRIGLAYGGALLSLCLVAGCGAGAQTVVESPTPRAPYLQAVSTSPSIAPAANADTSRPVTSHEPIARPTTDAYSFQATVEAVATLMPTFTPYGGRPNDPKSEAEQRGELLRQAAATVVTRDHLEPILEPLPTLVPPLTPWPGPATRVAGAGTIIETNACTIHKLTSTRNEWSETIGNQIVGVCAGSAYFGPKRAQIDVEVFDNITNQVLVGPDVYIVPAQVESVRITNAIGETLVLQADNGDFFYFDVSSRQWVSGTPSPHTPQPSPSPSVSPLPTFAASP